MPWKRVSPGGVVLAMLCAMYFLMLDPGIEADPATANPNASSIVFFPSVTTSSGRSSYLATHAELKNCDVGLRKLPTAILAATMRTRTGFRESSS